MASRRRIYFSFSRRGSVYARPAAAAAYDVAVPQRKYREKERTAMPATATSQKTQDTITMSDGTRIYYKEWGSGQPVVFSHGWPLSADAWEDQMVFLGSHGYRCIAHDRRGHGRSSQPWTGNEMNTYADDLAALVEALD